MYVNILTKALMKVARTHEVKPFGFSALDVKVALREFRTVRLGVPRRTGKTTAIFELHSEIPSVIVSALTAHAVSGMRRLYPGAHILSISELDFSNLPTKMLDAVFVEEGFLLKESEETPLFEWLAVCYHRGLLSEDFVCVMIGT